MAILLSTATTLVVFLPMILMPEDVMSRYFLGELGFPVCFAIASSLLVALLFTPLSTVWFGEGGTRAESRWLVWMSLRYERILGWILRRRFDTFLGVVGLILVTVLLPGQAVSCSESSENFWGDFEVEFSLDESMGMDDGLAIVEEVENIVEAHREAWGVRVHRGSYHGSSNWGHILVYLDEDKATAPKESLLDELEAALPEYPGVELSVERQDRGGDPRTNRIELEIRGDDSRVMMDLHEEVARRLTASPLILTARHDLEEEGGTELRLHLDRDAMEDRGMSAASVGPVLSFAMRGRELPRYWEGEWEVPVLARFEAQDRWSLEKLLDFQLGEDGATPLRAVVRTEIAPSAHRIVRSNRISALSVVVSMAEEVDREEGYAAIAAALNDMEFPQGYSWSLDNDQWDYANSDDAQKKAMILSVVLVFLLMGVLFESFLLPFCILFTIPMAFLGVFWTLYIVGANLDEMASVGLVVLVGVVVNNGIVLVDMVTQQRRQGVERREALRIAGRRRMRPILMTAMTTIMGLLPMAVGKQNLLGMPYASLAWVVIGGLTTGTVLTLFFLPLVYDALDDMRSVWSRFWGYAWSGSRKAS
jgi:HAE1 family hydrophobic/amphiphilic exporter-1